MCGIVGIYNYGRGERIDEGLLRRMNELLEHRGPDDAGIHIDGPVGMAMRRLSIIDLSSGHQPMLSEDGNLCIIFNGEIYNFQELTQDLLKKGHRFRTHSDTEVILHLYQEYGANCILHLRGMFAFALWDKSKERMMLARDRIGKKPLVYYLKDGQLAWASEIRALVELPGVSKEVDPQAIDLYLGLQYIPSPFTAFKSIRKLPPAHVMICEKGVTRLERYWSLPLDPSPLNISMEEAKEEIRAQLKEATRLRMVSEVPLGAFLSGGIDSTAVVAMMSQLSNRPVKTFSIGFEEQEFSELVYAREAAKFYGTDHREFIVKPDMIDVLPKLARHYGEPFGDSSALPTYYVARETKKHVTVALNGDGGDEAFGGYERYTFMQALSILPAFLREKMAPSLYFRLVGIFKDSEKEKMYTPGFHSRLEEAAPARSYLARFFKKANGLDFVNQLLSVDFSSYLPECLMAKVDIATMANSLEARSPFLDHRLIEFVFRLKGSWKLKGFGQTKWILKEALKKILPPQILNRPKMGFGIPIHSWFRGPLKNYWRENVLSSNSLSRGYFQENYLESLFQAHVSGRRDDGYRLWNLLMLELWHETYAPL